MIKHVYLFRLRQDADIQEVIGKLYSLKAHIPQILDMEVGLDFKHADNSYDLIESCTFANMEDFQLFGRDEYHDTIRKYMSQVQTAGVKIDYEI